MNGVKVLMGHLVLVVLSSFISSARAELMGQGGGLVPGFYIPPVPSGFFPPPDFPLPPPTVPFLYGNEVSQLVSA